MGNSKKATVGGSALGTCDPWMIGERQPYY